MFVKHVCPLSLNVTVTLTFDLETPNSIGVIYWSCQPPYQVRRSLGIVFYKICLRTDQRTDQPTNRHVQSNIPPLLSEESHISTGNWWDDRRWKNWVFFVQNSQKKILGEGKEGQSPAGVVFLFQQLHNKQQIFR